MNMPERFDLSCPVSGEPCPTRRNIRDAYLGNEKAKDIDKETRLIDRGLCQAKLAEHTLWAVGSGCEGPEDGACPARTSMSESKVRSSASSILRNLLKR